MCVCLVLLHLDVKNNTHSHTALSRGWLLVGVSEFLGVVECWGVVVLNRGYPIPVFGLFGLVAEETQSTERREMRFLGDDL